MNAMEEHRQENINTTIRQPCNKIVPETDAIYVTVVETDRMQYHQQTFIKSSTPSTSTIKQYVTMTPTANTNSVIEMNEPMMCSSKIDAKDFIPMHQCNLETININNDSHSNNICKNSQLKKSHSALVKILESAPINNKIPAVIVDGKKCSTTIIPSIQHDRQLFKSTTSELTIDQSNKINYHEIHDHTQHHQYHRKRNKHLNEINCDMDKSSDEEIGCNSNSSASSNSSDVEIICPWKKTRIAREWRQQQHKQRQHQQHQHDDDESNANKMNIDSINATKMTTSSIITAEQKSQSIHSNDIDDDVNDDLDDDDDEQLCKCYHQCASRRARSDSNESINTNDSGCDSDCPENITELCKNFDEKLSEQDVNIK